MADHTGLESNGAAALKPLLSRLRTLHQQIETVYEDVAFRHNAWNDFRKVVRHDLWQACERSDRYRQQLADQFITAVEKIDPDQLSKPHLHAVQRTFEKLERPHLSFDDVAECEQNWREIRVSTLPSFEAILQDWQNFYSIEMQEKDSLSKKQCE